MPRDRAKTVVSYRSGSGGRRLVFNPRDDGRYDLIEKTLTKGGEWREVGHEIVDDVHVEGAQENTSSVEARR